MKLRDCNHFFRYALLQFKRYYRQNARDHLSALGIALVDGTNALARSVLGLIIVFSSLITDLSKKEQQRWYRKETSEVKGGN